MILNSFLLCLRVLPKASTVNIVVYDGEPEKSILDNICAVRDTIKLMTVGELRADGRAMVFDARVPKKDDLALGVSPP